MQFVSACLINILESFRPYCMTFEKDSDTKFYLFSKKEG